MKRHLSLLACCIGLSGPAIGADGDIFADVMATPPGVFDKSPWFSAGHAFVCITLDLASGIKEDCYGFYHRDENNPATFIGSPSLNDEFKREPHRFLQVNWELKKKITSEQRRAFFDKVVNANRPEYNLLDNNCGDFVSDAVSAFGWKNVPKGVLPEPYLRDLVAANIHHFYNPSNKGTITRQGEVWRQHTPSVPDRMYDDEHRHDDVYMYVKDKINNVELRLPLKGGDYHYSYAGQPWRKTGTVQVMFDP